MIAGQLTQNVAEVTANWFAPIPLTVKFAKIDITADSTGGNGTSLVALVTGKKIRVLALALQATAGTTPKPTIQSGTNVLIGGMLVATAAGNAYVMTSPWGVCETDVGVALTIKGSNADNRFGGWLVYAEL